LLHPFLEKIIKISFFLFEGKTVVIIMRHLLSLSLFFYLSLLCLSTSPSFFSFTSSSSPASSSSSFYSPSSLSLFIYSLSLSLSHSPSLSLPHTLSPLLPSGKTQSEGVLRLHYFRVFVLAVVERVKAYLLLSPLRKIIEEINNVNGKLFLLLLLLLFIIIIIDINCYCYYHYCDYY